jgi:peroxiredoxin
MDQWAQAYGITFLLVPDHAATFWQAYARPDDPNYPPPGYVAFPLNVVLDRDQVVRYSLIGGGASEPAELDGIINTYVNTPASLTYPTSP